MNRSPTFTRRSILQQLATATVLGAAGGLLPARRVRAQAAAQRKFLFVIAAAGGGSIIDSFLPIATNESANGATIMTYPPTLLQQPAGSNIRCVHSPVPVEFAGTRITGELLPFVRAHGSDMAVVTQECTSVNHIIAQKRALTGAGIHAGRNILEAAAAVHGEGLLIPAVNMCESGYLEPGDDPALADRFRAVAVADALLFPFATDGSRGIKNAPAKDLLARARSIRNAVDDDSAFGITFRDAPLRQTYRASRNLTMPTMEQADLITKLTMVPNVPGVIPLDEFGLESSPDGQRVRQRFPNLISDPFEAQAALAFLLARHQVSCAVAISPSFNPLLDNGSLKNTPLAFDFSHTNHVLTQYAMWSRIMKVANGLVSLLKEQDVDDNDPSQGKMWDRSVIYIATDFGRDKVRPANSLQHGTGHHLNNGNVIVSPLIRGNAVYGGVDKDTGLTFGFDPTSGAATPGTVMREGDVYSVVAHALGIDFEGRVDMPAIVRA